MPPKVVAPIPPANFNEFMAAKKKPKGPVKVEPITPAPPAPRAKPSGESTLDTTIEDVRRTVQSACLTLLRWEGHAKFRDVRGNTLRSFSEGVAQAVLEVAQLAEGEDAEAHNDHGLKIPPAEISLALMSAALIILYRYEILQPEQAKAFLGQLARGV